jgi:hypothetical protein
MKKLILGALLLLSTVSFGQNYLIYIDGQIENKKLFYDICIETYFKDKDEKISFAKTTDTFDTTYWQTTIQTPEIPDSITISLRPKFSYKVLKTKTIYPQKDYINGNSFIYKDLELEEYIQPIILINNFYKIPPTAGDELQIYTRHFYMGTSLSLIGFSLIAVSPIYNIEGGVVSGVLFGLIGSIIVLEAPRHIKRAGFIMNDNGVGVGIKLKKLN